MIKLIKSSFYNEAETKKRLVEFIMQEDILSMNKECQKFEKDFAKKQGSKYAVYVSNGSVANLLLIQSLLNDGRLKRGDKVGFSALTWSTNVMPLIQLGLQPVPLDCELSTLNVSPDTLHTVSDDIQAMFITNVLGFSDDIVQIAKICQEKDILFIEDNCESLGSSVKNKKLGNYGLASTFSFFVGHHMSTIEGGMVCTNDDNLYRQLVMGRAHGWDRNLPEVDQRGLRKSHGVDDFYAKYTFYDIASNFRPTEICGFIGNQQLPYWDIIVSKRVSNFQTFNSIINNNPDFFKLNVSHMDIPSNFAMPVVCKTAELAEHYKKKFVAANVEIRPIIAGNMVEQPFFKKYVSNIYPDQYPNASLVHSRGFYFGNNPELTDEEISTLAKLLEKR